MEPTSTPQRKGIRYDGYDYRRSGAYFVTICATKGQSIFGKVIDGMISQSPLGEIAHHCWTELPTHFSYIALDSFVIMPNHVHGLLWLHPLSTQVGTVSVQIDTDAAARTDAIHGVLSPSPSESNRNSDHLDTSSLKGDPPRRFGPPIAGSLSTIISTYKAAVTRQARHNGLWGSFALWHSRFWDRIVRHDVELNNIRRYIAENPVRWADDQLHPNAPPNRFNQWTERS